MLKIQNSTSKLMTLERQKYSKFSYFLGNFILLVFFIVPTLPGMLIILTAELTSLKCNRLEPTQVNCQLTSSSLLGKKNTSIKQLKGAEVQVHTDSEGDTYEEVLLVTKDDNISLPFKVEEAKKINIFISNPEHNLLLIEHDNRLDAYIIGVTWILFWGICILLILSLKFQTSCIFDKKSGRMYLTKNNFFQI